MATRPTFALLSLAANIERHNLASGEPWLMLLLIQWPGPVNPTASQQYLRLVRNLDPVTFDAGDGLGPQVYSPFNFEFGDLTVSTNGQVPETTIKASNVMRVLQTIIEQYAGIVGANLTVFIVNSANPAGEPDLSMAFTIKQSVCDAKLVTFKLGASSPLRRLFPIHMYRPNFCIWQYKGLQCGYTGTALTGQTIEGCLFVFNLSSLAGVYATNTLTGPTIPLIGPVPIPADATVVLVQTGFVFPCSTTAGSPVYTLLGYAGTVSGVAVSLTAAQMATLLVVGQVIDLPGGGVGSHPTIVSIDTVANTMTLSANAAATATNVDLGVEMPNLAMSAPATQSDTGVALFTSFTTCSHTIDGATGCEAHLNLIRIGTFPGIDSNGAAVASVA